MNIGHYAPDLWAPGGVSVYVRRLGAAQRAEGHAVHYFSRTAAPDDVENATAVDDDAALFRTARQRGVDVLHLHKPVQQLPSAPLPLVRTMHDNVAACPSGSRYLRRTGQPCNRTYSAGGCLWGHLVDRCGSRRPHKVAGHFARIERERRLLPRMTTIAVSRFVRDWMVRTGYPEDNLFVLHSPAPAVTTPAVPPPASGVPRFLFMGRLVPHKGPDWLLRAAARADAPLHLDVAGTGPERAALETLAQELGLADRVTFHGWLGDEALSQRIAAARAVVFPSVWHEPAGLVSLEAAAHGRALVAGRVGGVPEYTSSANAFLVPPRDVEALADRLAFLTTHHDVATRMGRAGREWVRASFAMDDFLDRLHALYRRATDRAPAAFSTS